MEIMKFVIIALISYFLGSVNFSILISKLTKAQDIRNYGSGNAGFTNTLRTFGAKPAIFAFGGDLLKGFVSALIALLLAGEQGAYIAWIFCILGHMYPIYFGFKGGKGIVVSLAHALMINWIMALILLAIFLVVFFIKKYVSMGSIVAISFLPIYVIFFSHKDLFIIICAVFIAAFVIFTHKKNIVRIINGTESAINLTGISWNKKN